MSMREKIARAICTSQEREWSQVSPVTQADLKVDADAVIATLPECIEPLEWVKFNGNYDSWEARTPVGIYIVIQYDSHVALLGHTFKRSDFTDTERAMKAAWEHYREQVMSAFGGED